MITGYASYEAVAKAGYFCLTAAAFGFVAALVLNGFHP
jgi:hypothetical protein